MSDEYIEKDKSLIFLFIFFFFKGHDLMEQNILLQKPGIFMPWKQSERERETKPQLRAIISPTKIHKI